MTANADETAAKDYGDLLDKLDLPTNVRLLTGAAAVTLHPVEAIGLAEVRLSDGPIGVRGPGFRIPLKDLGGWTQFE